MRCAFIQYLRVTLIIGPIELAEQKLHHTGHPRRATALHIDLSIDDLLQQPPALLRVALEDYNIDENRRLECEQHHMCVSRHLLDNVLELDREVDKHCIELLVQDPV